MLDPFENKDLFYKEIPDGVTSVKCGFIGAKDTPLAFVGSNCSIQGFDLEGDEKYWNMTSDNVMSICFCDIDEDEEYELIVGCEDASINIFKGEELLYEIDESAAITTLSSFGMNFYGFAMRNGSYGVYEGRNLLWKEKYKDGIIGMSTVYGESRNGIVCGFRDGNVEVRDHLTGEVYFNKMMDGQLSSLLRSKFVGFDKDQVLVVLRNGEVYGFDVSWESRNEAIVTKPTGNLSAITELKQQKNVLKSKLKNMKEIETGVIGKKKQLIPQNTSLKIGFKFNFKKKCPELVFTTNSSAVVKGAVIRAEKLFEYDMIS